MWNPSFTAVLCYALVVLQIQRDATNNETLTSANDETLNSANYETSISANNETLISANDV